MKKIALLTSISFLCFGQPKDSLGTIKSCSPWGIKTRNEARLYVTKVADTWLMTQPSAHKTKWDWGEGVLTHGLTLASQATKTGTGSPYSEFVHNYIKHYQRKNVELIFSDDFTPINGGLELYNSDSLYYQSLRPIIDRTASAIMKVPRAPTGMIDHFGFKRKPQILIGENFIPIIAPESWVDTLFHTIFILSRYTELTGDKKYQQEAVNQLLLFSKYIQDPKSKLFTHGYISRERSFLRLMKSREIPNFKFNEFWARGNGWVISSMVDLVSKLPKDDTDNKNKLLASLLPLEEALRKNQNKQSGMFHTVIRKKDTYEETSGSALIIYAMAKGVREGIFGEETRKAVLLGFKGLKAVLKETKSGNTVVTKTSGPTGPGVFLYKLVRKKDQIHYGVGAWLMAASEIAGLYDQKESPVCGFKKTEADIENPAFVISKDETPSSKEEFKDNNNQVLEISKAKKIRLLNNPVVDFLNLSFTNDVKQLEIYSISGKLIMSTNAISDKIDVTNINSGYYIAKLIFEKQPSESIKFLKK